MIRIDFSKVAWNSPIAPDVYPYDQGENWIIKRVLAQDTKQLIQCFDEIVLSFRLNHANILPLQGYFIEIQTIHSIYLKYPRMKESLKDYTDKNLPFEEKNTIRWFYQLISAVGYMHEHGITHRDIKPANILLDSEDQIKLADFGVSKYLGDEDRKTIIEKGSQFMAPEMKNDDSQINWYKADVWSLGIVLLELYSISGNHLKDINVHIEDWLNETIPILKDEKLSSVLKKMLSVHANERPSLKEIRAEVEYLYPELLVYLELVEMKFMPYF